MKKSDAIQQIAAAMERRDAALLDSLHEQARGRDVATVTAIPRDYKSLAEAKFKEAQTKRAFDDVMAAFPLVQETAAVSLPPGYRITGQANGYTYHQLLEGGWTLSDLLKCGHVAIDPPPPAPCSPAR